MSSTHEELIRRFAEGTLTPDAQAEFNGIFESDPLFAGKATEALGLRLGPVPEAFVDRVTAAARPGLEEAWKLAGPKAVPVSPGMLSFWPVAALAGAFFAVLGTGAFLVYHQAPEPHLQAVPSEAPKSSLPPLQGFDADASAAAPVGKPSAIHSTLTAVAGKVQEGTKIRIQDLPADPSVTVEILGGNGAVLRGLYQGPWKNDQTIDWDGLDQAGHPVAPGPYRAKVTTSKKTYISEFTVQ